MTFGVSSARPYIDQLEPTGLTACIKACNGSR